MQLNNLKYLQSKTFQDKGMLRVIIITYLV